MSYSLHSFKGVTQGSIQGTAIRVIKGDSSTYECIVNKTVSLLFISCLDKLLCCKA